MTESLSHGNLMTSPNNYDVIIAGGGPAGASAAIQLALNGAHVLLIEEKTFPRAKLCGEFISPECLTHFKRLGVLDQMTSAGGIALHETVFYSRRGHSIAVPSEWFGSGATALGLSRSEMDRKLLERAKDAGVEVLEKTHASGLIREGGRVRGLSVKTIDAVKQYRSLITIDATGRARALARYFDNNDQRGMKRKRKTKPPFVAFKVHLENGRVADGACEIYFYSGGYGGLSGVEGGASNLCFIVSADDVRRHGSDPEVVMREVLMKNARANYTLAEARTRPPWLSVALDSFGPRTLTPAVGLVNIGDAAAFIDPFTGSGMLMALESGQMAAEIISRHLPRLRQERGSESPGSETTGFETLGFEKLADDYRTEHSSRFNSRLRVSGLLRRAAFVPRLAEAALLLFSANAGLRRKLARATRPRLSRKVKPYAG